MTLAFAPLDDVENNQFFRPITKGFIALSEALLSISSIPSSRTVFISGNNFLAYPRALPKALLGSASLISLFTYSSNSSRSGAVFSSLISYLFS